MTKSRHEGCDAEVQLLIQDVAKDERETSDKLYAKILVERIVYGMVGLIITTVVLALLAVVIRKNAL